MNICSYVGARAHCAYCTNVQGANPKNLCKMTNKFFLTNGEKCDIIYTEREVNTMKYFVQFGYHYQEFPTYRDAEIYCGMNNIPCDEIYEIEEGE